jgi:N-acyl homoserine lactone hydrolase
MSTSTNSPVRLYLLQVATLPGSNTPIVCYLVQTGDGANILIDTGLPPNVTPPPGFPMPIMGDNVIMQLARIGVQPEDVQTLIATHYDMDHCGNNDLFPNAEIIVQREHHQRSQDNPRATVSRDHWDQPNQRRRFVDGDTVLRPGLELIETSGHMIGHQSVLVRLPQTGAVLLAIDAVTQEARFNTDIKPSPMDENGEMLVASVAKLHTIAEREQAALVIFGHDPDQWATLRKLPESYQ